MDGMVQYGSAARFLPFDKPAARHASPVGSLHGQNLTDLSRVNRFLRLTHGGDITARKSRHELNAMILAHLNHLQHLGLGQA